MQIDKFKIEEWMNKYECHAKYDMTTTCIKSFSLKEFFEFTNSNIDSILNKSLDYGDITGSSRLKTNAAKLYKNKNENNISITLGAIGANSLVFTTLLEKNDEVVSIIPTYQQHYSIPKQLGCNVKIIKLKPELKWHIDFEELDKNVTSRTKLITLNNPNNPTGAILSEQELLNIVEIARKNDAYILCDEVYRFLNHDKDSCIVSIADIYEKGISTFSMSKTFSLAGIRIGFIVAEQNLIQEFNHQRQYNTISISAIDDYIACIALENKEKIISRNTDIILKGKEILTEWVKGESKIDLIEPEAGTTAFVSYKKNINSYRFCLDLYKKTGVLLLPGDAMEIPNHCRVGYCGNIDVFKEGLNEFSKWLITI
ncbi:aminotransferase class I/II-fold pyridoxal phosphate-dependent enzyme [bacterium]|nr:aminotransferase class I/II-fold pyridoxal phosphate-dependent enzyme [bacterium]